MVVRGVANGILDALGLNYAANGQFMIHVALVSPICGRNADVHWRVGLVEFRLELVELESDVVMKVTEAPSGSHYRRKRL